MRISIGPDDTVEIDYVDATGRVVKRSALTGGGWPEQPDRSIVQVKLPADAHVYAYRNADAATIGDTVTVVLPGGEPVNGKVVGYGRGTYTGAIYKGAWRPNG